MRRTAATLRLRWPRLLLTFLLFVGGLGLSVWWWWPKVQQLPPGVTLQLWGHREVVVGDDGMLLPLFLGPLPAFELCLQTPPSTPTSQWEARLDVVGYEKAGSTFAPSSSRLDTTLCFRVEHPEKLPAAADLEVCGEVRDQFDGQSFRLPCQPLRYQRDDGERSRLLAEMTESVRRVSEGGLEELVAALDGLADRARAAALPFLSLRINLVLVHYLRLEGTLLALQSATERLSSLPAWLGRPEAGEWAAHTSYEKALVALAVRGDLRTAWQHLAIADRLCLKHLNPIRLTVRLKQAEILARSGALPEAVDRVTRALADCQSMRCSERLVVDAHGVLAWFLLLDPRTEDEDLARAAQSFEKALVGTGAVVDPLEDANQRINLAYLELRRGRDPQPQLEVATGLLVASRSETAHSRLLLGWADLVAGLAAFEQGDIEQALVLCGRAKHAEFPRLAAWAKSCTGEALRRQGDLEAARESFESSILFHEIASGERLGLSLNLGPGPRAEAFYRAARVAVEEGDVSAAWSFLARLDDLTVSEAALSPCRENTAENSTVRAELLRSLADLDGPASGARRRQRESIRRSLRERLQEFVREQPGCTKTLDDERGREPELQLRAFALDDEILLLRRESSGGIVLERRTLLPRRELLPLLSSVTEELERRRLDDVRWRQLLTPLAQALVPRNLRELGPVTTFALHGVLQGVPLEALPLPAESGEQRWLGEATTVALVPSGLGGVASSQENGAPLFVVDPLGNLPGGSQLVDHYRRLFPDGRILVQGAATKQAFRRALPMARWLHIDAHSRFDPAFPELSTLELADGPMTLAELAELPGAVSFANLSACRTGNWPITADRGRFGIAGLFARRGARWVVASRSELEDRLAAEFNRVFYQVLAEGQSVPQAYAQAAAGVRQQAPAASWSSFFLLYGGEGGKRGSP